jgi:hypothetical protein
MTTVYALVGILFSSNRAYPVSEPFTIAAVRTEAAIVIDGSLDEEAWAQAAEITDFVQFVPTNGKPASLPTVGKILYDDEYFYVGILAYDPQTNMIQLGTGKRDGLSSATGTDSVTVAIDTFDDDQNCYFFRTNIQGVQHDGRVSDNGRAADEQWDGIWKSAGDYFDEGWIAEFAIPLETIKYQPGKDMTWGFQISRYIPRNREQSFWTGPLEDYRRIDGFGSLTNLNLERASRRLEVIPYVSGRFQEDEDPGASVGLDARYSFTQLVSGILTLNPDFATVEADQEQVNLTRFELNLPEKRKFFLEDTQLYQQRIRLFYSRRIADIHGGAKVYRQSESFELSGMTVQAKEVEPGEGSANFTTLRAKRNVMGSSTIGFIGANKYVNEGSQGTVGLDTALYFTDTFSFTGQLAGSYGKGNPSDLAFFVRPSYDSSTFHIHGRYTFLGEHFGDNANAVGFILDDNRRELDSAITKAFWLNNSFLERIDYKSNYNIYWGVDKTLRSWDVWNSLTFDLQNKFSFTARYEREYKLFEKEFDNEHTLFEVGYNTREWQSVRVSYRFGKNFDSDFTLWKALLKHNITKDLSFEYDLSKLYLDPDPENESTWIHVIRATQSFTADFYVSFFYQINTVIDKRNIQAVMVYRFQPPFGLFQIAYQKGTAEFGEVGAQGHTVFLKFAYVF